MTNDKGNPIVNPRFALIDRFRKTHDAILRGLQVSRPGVNPETIAKRRRDAAGAERMLPAVDSLLAQPGMAVQRGKVVPFKGAGR